ncbi:MAG TPA: hypothetical protein VIV60_24915 [Polyangiaceae bacterium]
MTTEPTNVFVMDPKDYFTMHAIVERLIHANGERGFHFSWAHRGSETEYVDVVIKVVK